MSQKLQTHGKTYELDMYDINVIRERMAQTIWIVEIQDESEGYVTSARVSGEQDIAIKAAENWLNMLVRANPGMLLRYRVTQYFERNDAK